MGLVPGQGGWFTEPEWQGDPWPTDGSNEDSSDSVDTSYDSTPANPQPDSGYSTYRPTQSEIKSESISSSVVSFCILAAFSFALYKAMEITGGAYENLGNLPFFHEARQLYCVLVPLFLFELVALIFAVVVAILIFLGILAELFKR